MLAWREALDAEGIELAVWRIHRKIGMSGGLFANALSRRSGSSSSHELRNPLAPILTALELMRLQGDEASSVSEPSSSARRSSS